MNSQSLLERIKLHYETIAILFPTKSRPRRVRAMINSCLSKADLPEQIRFVSFIDYGDIESIPSDMIDKIEIIQGNKMWLSLMYNTLASIHQAEIYMYAADDIVFTTSGWDTEVRESFKSLPEGFGLVFANDLSTYQGQIATHGFVKKIWIDTLGYLLPPYFVDTHTDLWITNLARNLGVIRYLPNVKIEHAQYRQGKAEMDETYAARIQSTSIRRASDTQEKLKVEFRTHLVIAALKHNLAIPTQAKYLLGTLIERFFPDRFGPAERIKILSTGNFKILKSLIKKGWRRVKD
jgi:hypothetical protein